jgi:hypothetical protein
VRFKDLVKLAYGSWANFPVALKMRLAAQMVKNFKIVSLVYKSMTSFIVFPSWRLSNTLNVTKVKIFKVAIVMSQKRFAWAYDTN